MPAMHGFRIEVSKGLFIWREEDPSTRKILKGETTFRVGLHTEISVRVFNRREGINEQR